MRNDDAEQAQLGHPLDDPHVEVVVDVVFDRVRQDSLVDERTDGLLDQFLFRAQREFHAASLIGYS